MDGVWYSVTNTLFKALVSALKSAGRIFFIIIKLDYAQNCFHKIMNSIKEKGIRNWLRHPHEGSDFFSKRPNYKKLSQMTGKYRRSDPWMHNLLDIFAHGAAQTI